MQENKVERKNNPPVFADDTVGSLDKSDDSRFPPFLPRDGIIKRTINMRRVEDQLIVRESIAD